MRILPWQNPLVGTALQVRNRRGGLYTTPILYVLLLAVAGMGVFYWASLPQNAGQVQPAYFYFLGLMGVQIAIGAIGVGSRAGAAIKAEVVNKTLDFQRLASVSSWDILAGKLFGEPAMPYLLIFASFPLGMFCFTYGVPGLTLPVLVLIYINLFTTAVMFGAFSLQNTLNIPAGKASGGAVAGFGILLGLTAMFTFQLAVAGGQSFYQKPWSGALAGLLTPLPQIFALAGGDPWAARLTLFDFEIPYLIATSISQTLVAALCLSLMARRLENLSQPVLGKPVGYLALALVDLMIVGVLHACRTDAPLGLRLVLFCVLHSVAVAALLGGITPHREMLTSWLWRFRGRRPRWLDEWLGDRTLNTAATLTAALLMAAGIVILAGLETDPSAWVAEVYFTAASSEERNVATFLPALLLIAPLVLFFAGSLFQWLLLVAGSYGGGLFFITMLLLLVGPAAVGGYIAQIQAEVRPANFAFDLAVPLHILAWGGAPVALPRTWPILFFYGGLTLFVVVDNYRRTARLAAAVNRKLSAMGVIAKEA